MNKSVYVCNFGANLPCDSKADTDKNPTQPMQDFCKANPTADIDPHERHRPLDNLFLGLCQRSPQVA